MEDVGRPGIEPAGDGTGGEASAEAADRRQRDSMFLTARLTVDGDPAAREVRVRNLSEGGLMIEADRVIDPATAVALTIRGLGEVTGHVAWCTAGRIGVAFDRPVDPRRARKPVGNGTTTPGYAKPLLHVKATPHR